MEIPYNGDIRRGGSALKVLVLGARGILGSEVVRVLGEGHEVILRTHGELDITDPDALKGESSG